jgi:hypothetical protein
MPSTTAAIRPIPTMSLNSRKSRLSVPWHRRPVKAGKPDAARKFGRRGKTATANLAALCYENACVDS